MPATTAAISTLTLPRPPRPRCGGDRGADREADERSDDHGGCDPPASLAPIRPVDGSLTGPAFPDDP